jgi:hypothetical protein
MVGRRDGGDTYVFPIAAGAADDLGNFPSSNRFDAARLAEATPIVTNTVTDGISSNNFAMGLHWTF